MTSLGLIAQFLAVCLVVSCLGEETPSPDLVIRNIDRKIDVSSQLFKVTCRLTLENTGKTPINKFFFAVDPPDAVISFIAAYPADSSKAQPRIAETRLTGKPERFWRIDLKESIQAGKLTVIEVEYVATDALAPYPTAITQKEKQLIRVKGSHYVYSPYVVIKQTTVISTGTRNIESFTKRTPAVSSDGVITYGPYQKIEPFTYDPMMIHYENNAPFLKVTHLERVIEVSHWGNIAVEETVDIVHTGATLKGPFSRYDYQREAQSGLSSVKSFKTVLPAAATDAYYRDDIGNISTSHMRILSDSVELDLRPRFPLFGGWKTHYVLGYNVPSYEYLYQSGDNFKLKMRILDHIFDDMIVENLVTKIILPEGSENLELKTPFPMSRLPDSRHFTYLDTRGRPVITVSQKNLVENHIQDFELDYFFPRILMLQEPLLVVTAFFLLFILVIIYVRLDFSISKDEAVESRMRVSGLLEKFLQHFDNRSNLYTTLEEQLAKLKSTKDVTAFNSAAKVFNQEYKNESAHITDLLAKIKPDAPDIADKLTELQKLDKILKNDVYQQKQTVYVEKLIPTKINRDSFIELEKSLNKKRDEAIEKMNAIIKTLH